MQSIEEKREYNRLRMARIRAEAHRQAEAIRQAGSRSAVAPVVVARPSAGPVASTRPVVTPRHAAPAVRPTTVARPSGEQPVSASISKQLLSNVNSLKSKPAVSGKQVPKQQVAKVEQQKQQEQRDSGNSALTNVVGRFIDTFFLNTKPRVTIRDGELTFEQAKAILERAGIPLCKPLDARFKYGLKGNRVFVNQGSGWLLLTVLPVKRPKRGVTYR